MAIKEISSADLNGKGVIGLPDTPKLSAPDMQRKFEELELDVIIPKVNELIKGINEIVSILTGVEGVTTEVTDDDTLIPTAGAIVDYVSGLGYGDMLKSVYDKDNDGVVDNASKLGGLGPETYAKKADLEQVKDAASGIGLSVVDGKLCITYKS